MIRDLLKGAIGPKDNDSRFLLDVHRRDLPGEDTMCRYDDTDEVDICIVGAGAGGSVLAQRLARAGWRVVIIEAGPFWHPDEDWVSDEAGSHELYWNQKRIIGGADPIEMGKNNSGRGVGGSMVHYAGYTPRFHPSDFHTRSLDGVGADWPIEYDQLRPHYETVERELPVAGQDWPWGHPHKYPFSPHPVSEAASVIWRGAIAQGIQMRVGPVGIVNGTFGNRPHCIYRGWCLQGCKVNAKASPYVTHLPDALAHRVEIRSACMAARVELDAKGRAAGVTYIREGDHVERLQRARSRGRGRLLHRDTPAPAQLHLTPLPERTRQQRRPSRALRDGPGRNAERRAVPDRAAHVQSPAPGDLLRGLLRDRPIPRFRPGVLHPNRLPPADRVGRARPLRGALGPGPARIHARLQPLDHRRSPQRTPRSPRQPSHPGVGDRPLRVAGGPLRLHPGRQRQGQHGLLRAKSSRTSSTPPGPKTSSPSNVSPTSSAGPGWAPRPPTASSTPNQRTWAVPNLFISDGSVCPTQGSANPALTIMALASRLAERMISGGATSPANR